MIGVVILMTKTKDIPSGLTRSFVKRLIKDNEYRERLRVIISNFRHEETLEEVFIGFDGLTLDTVKCCIEEVDKILRK